MRFRTACALPYPTIPLHLLAHARTKQTEESQEMLRNGKVHRVRFCNACAMSYPTLPLHLLTLARTKQAEESQEMLRIGKPNRIDTCYPNSKAHRAYHYIYGRPRH